MQHTSTTKIIWAQQALNYELADFVRDGLRDAGNQECLSITLLTGCLGEQTLLQLKWALEVQSRSPSTSRKKSDIEDVDEAEQVYRAYVTHQKEHFIRVLASAPVAVVRTLAESRQKAICDELQMSTGLEYPSAATADEVVRAWNLSRVNRLRAAQRASSLLYLRKQANSRYDLDQKQMEDESKKALAFFMEQCAHFRGSELKLAVLLGSDALAITRAQVIEDSFSKGMSVIQYLQVDEQHPGRWSSDTEENFRAKLAEYAAR